MVEFDRRAAALETVKGLSDNEINRVGELYASGDGFEELMGEFRDALRRTYESDTSVRDMREMSPGEIVGEENMIPVGDADRMAEFMVVGAAWQFRAGDVPFDEDEPVMAFVASVLGQVYTGAMANLLQYVESAVDEEEADHDADEADDSDDEEE